MNTRKLLYLFACTTLLGNISYANAAAPGDTLLIGGGELNPGSLESAINGDTTSTGARKNPVRVYALNQGQVYFQRAPIFFNDPDGTLIIVGVPSINGTKKPVILMDPLPGAPIGTNMVYGSIKIIGVHWQAMQLNSTINNELFYCGTGATQAQSLTIDNCLFEFSCIDLFDCSDELGAIGGWPHGAKFRITNSYFRNLFNPDQWWNSRIFQCTHLIDSMWIENNTIVGGGLTFLQKRQLTDFQFINHNTILNNKKYWLNSPYKHISYIINNIFVNQNWVGEDTIVTSSGQDPDNEYMSTINVDTNNYTNGEVVPDRYRILGDTVNMSNALDFDHMLIYVADNINYDDPQLSSGYYNNSKYLLASLGALPSYIEGWYPNSVFPIHNVPGMWMNSRTRNLFADHLGPFLEARTHIANPELATPAIANAGVVDTMAIWNQRQWGDPRFPIDPAITNSGYIVGDYNPLTIPGVKTENGSGITTFTDLSENFSQTKFTSVIDGLPIGSLIWNDSLNAAFMAGSPAARLNMARAQNAADGNYPWQEGVLTGASLPLRYSLSQNYPNPFNPSTTIRFMLAKASIAKLTVFNVLGQKIVTLVDGYLQAGEHAVRFDGTKHSSGTYFCRLEAGSYTAVKRMILLK